MSPSSDVLNFPARICSSSWSSICEASSARRRAARSRAINKTLEQESNSRRKSHNVLVLGTKGAGKSTLVQRMVLAHGWCSQDELHSRKVRMYPMIIQWARDIIISLQSGDREFNDLENKRNAGTILQYRIKESSTSLFSSEVAAASHCLCEDPVMEKALQNCRHSFPVLKAANFLPQVIRLCRPCHVPTEKDIVPVGGSTTGATETSVNMGRLKIRFYEIGNQTLNVKSWSCYTEDIDNVIFCVNLDDYDQMVQNQNRLALSLLSFEAVVNSRLISPTGVILFLNKVDLFRMKLPNVPLANFFPEYNGGDDVSLALRFILWRFLRLNHSQTSIYPHVSQATDIQDSSCTQLIAAAFKETILTRALRDSGILP